MLGTATQRLERAMCTPANDPTWRPGMTRAVAHLRTAFGEHVDVTEGPAGLYAGLLEHAPRLARGLHLLVDEHRRVLSSLRTLEGRLRDGEAGPDDVRRQAARLLHQVGRHRQRGADLIYEAYSTDLGGET
jgi:hypothetical protein